MKWKLILAMIAGLMVIDPACGEELIKRSEYNRMPQVFVYDHYDECLFDEPEVETTTYCLVRAVIKPDNGSELWRMIEKFSSKTKMHLNHASLDRGICVRGDVKDALAKLKVDNVSALVVPKFEIGFPYIFGHNSFRNVEPYKRNYSELMAAIINKDLSERYGLKAYTEIEYCDRAGVDEFPIDGLDIAFLVIVAVLVVVMAASSWYDASCKSENGLNHYQEDMPSHKAMLLSSFSAIRNWYRLVSHSRDPTSRDLRMIQAIRHLTFVLTLIGHASMMVQSRTGWIVEQKYRELATMIIINGFQIVTTFFTISGLVFTITYVEKMRESGRKPGVLEIVIITVNRYIRLTPVYALFLLFEATWFIRLQDGPFWRRGVETSMINCRRNWWINLLYVNNYFKPDQPCMQHSWYLAADFQLSTIGLVLVTLVIRFPRLKKTLITIVTAIAVIIPGVVVYLGSYEGVTIFSPESRRFMFWYDIVYYKTYLPMHMNLGMYMCGIIIGFLYLKYRNAGNRFRRSPWFRLAFFSIFIVGPGMFLIGRIFYVNDYPKPSVWMSVYFAGARVMWGLVALMGFCGFAFRISKPVTRIMNIKFFEVLGRLTYGAYVGHFFMIKMMYYNTRELSNLGSFDVAVKINSTLYLSYMLSLAITLLVELPISALQKQLLQTFVKPGSNASSEGQVTPELKRNGTGNGSFTNEGFKTSFKGNIHFLQQQQRL
ncbi:hypothetical protein quinque_004041 [Culex quinquefasciatus]